MWGWSFSPSTWTPVCAETEPFSEGESAFYAGEPKSANPYASEMAADWDEGWENAEYAAKSDPVSKP